MNTKANKLRIGSVCSECGGISLDGFKLNVKATEPSKKSSKVVSIVNNRRKKKSSEVTALF